MFEFLSLIYNYIRPLIKWFLRRCTRLCELQRIIYGDRDGALRKKSVETSLMLSRQIPVKRAIENLNQCIVNNTPTDDFHAQMVPHAVSIILKIKKIKLKVHPDFAISLAQSVEAIWGYRRLCNETEKIRQVAYDSNNMEHERKLIKLWDLLMPDQPLESRIGKQWQEIGFQGDDPYSDFRGMGVLGLDNLLYFAKEYNDIARQALLHSLHPIHGYTFAIVGINLTSTAFNLLQDGSAKTHFYNLPNQRLTMREFHQFYCYLFYEFDKLWMHSRPNNLMEFPKIYSNFLQETSMKLKNNKTIFKLNLPVENI